MNFGTVSELMDEDPIFGIVGDDPVCQIVGLSPSCVPYYPQLSTIDQLINHYQPWTPINLYHQPFSTINHNSLYHQPLQIVDQHFFTRHCSPFVVMLNRFAIGFALPKVRTQASSGGTECGGTMLRSRQWCHRWVERSVTNMGVFAQVIGDPEVIVGLFGLFICFLL